MQNSLNNLTPAQKHTLKLMVDFEYCASAILKVQTTEDKIEPFRLNKPQQILADIFDKIKETRLLRVVILKGRRMGVSTLVSGRFYQKTSFFPNKYAMQITHEPQATDFLFRMVKRFYDLSPDQIRPSIRANNLTLLEFNTKDGRGLNSGFRVATSGKSDIGSGQLIHYLHLSECAKMDPNNLQTLLTAVSQCVPKSGKADTEIIYESTAQGIGGIFYDKFWNARYRYWIEKLDEHGEPVIKESVNEKAAKENIETSVFIPWFCFELNRLGCPDWVEWTPEELEYKALYGLDDEQMYWRRFTIANECRNSIHIFNQEHPTKPEDAFLGTGNPVFDNEKLHKYRSILPEPIARYRCQMSTQQWASEKEGELTVWEEAKPGKRYIIGADVAEGIGIGDFSVAAVIDHATGEQVAEWHGHCDPDEFGTILVSLGKRYNVALLAVERNNHGLMTVTTIVNERYSRVYSEMVPEPPGPPRKRYGWRTDSKTKPLILDHLVKEVREDSHGIRSDGLIEEMMSFKRQDNGKMEADVGRHDDRVIAYAIAKHVRQVTPVPRAAGGEGRIVSNTTLRKRRSTLGWT
jgi:hypothetical protein